MQQIDGIPQPIKADVQLHHIQSKKKNQDGKLIVGIVAGEASGDALGADFMRQLNNLRNDVIWVGVGGEKMKKEGLRPLFDMERLAVMGLVEVIRHYPRLKSDFNRLLEAFEDHHIDWFIGIDAPDFNLRLAKILKSQGVFCVQYVSPSIWAWRENRIHTIKESTHLVLCLFPFEVAVYERHQHPAVYVGHPMLDNLDPTLLNTPKLDFRRKLAWQDHQGKTWRLLDYFEKVSHLICMMPGSRKGEITKILPVMLDTATELLQDDPDFGFVIPTLKTEHQQLIAKILKQYPPKVQAAVLVAYAQDKSNFSQKIMLASDIILLASGTATLEATLLMRPMVVVYRLNWLTYEIAKMLVQTPYISLPNILAQKAIVPELIQDEANPDNIYNQIADLCETQAYYEQHQALKKITEQMRQTQKNQKPAVYIVLDHWIAHLNANPA